MINARVLTHLEAQTNSPVTTPQRTATAWIGRDVMLGGELTQLTRDAGPGSSFGQFHPATAHWRIGADDVGAFALHASPAVDARAEAGRLTIVTQAGDSTFRIAAPGMLPDAITLNRWTLPHLTVTIDTDAADFALLPGPTYIDVVYRAATRFDLRVTHHP